MSARSDVAPVQPCPKTHTATTPARQVANEDGVEERLSDAAPLTDGKKCKIRPVHIFLGVACCMTLCGFVLTVYGGVKIYYHDVFKARVYLEPALPLELRCESRLTVSHHGRRA